MLDYVHYICLVFVVFGKGTGFGENCGINGQIVFLYMFSCNREQSIVLSLNVLF